MNDACRALDSTILRQEIYGLDGPVLTEPVPFVVTENNYTVVTVQALPDNHGYSVFRVDPRESLTCHLERNPLDPRIAHSMTIEVNSYGNVLKYLDIAYGRAVGQSTLDTLPRAVQEMSLLLYNENTCTNAISTPNDYFLPAPASSCQYQIDGYGQARRLDYNQFSSPYLTSLETLPFETSGDIKTFAKRVVQESCVKYRSNDLSQLRDVGFIESMGLPGQSYQLTFTPGLFKTVVGRDSNSKMEGLISNKVNLLKGQGPGEGGYVHIDAIDSNWWTPSNLTYYHRDNVPAAEELIEARSHFF